jgi:transposase-like protein
VSGCGWRQPGGSPAARLTSQIARDMRVTEGSVRRWRRTWRDGGTEALNSAFVAQLRPPEWCTDRAC